MAGTGEWVVRECWETGDLRYHLIRPDGTDDTPEGFDNFSEPDGYAQTYNMNADKAAEFRTCPFCGLAAGSQGCPWCS